MDIDEPTEKHIFAKLEIIVPKISFLLKIDVDIKTFHRECSGLYPRLVYAIAIMRSLIEVEMTPLKPTDIYLDNLANELIKVRYIPEEIPSKKEFITKFTEDEYYCYDLFEWMFKNRIAIAIRCYFAIYADPIDMSLYFYDDLEINKECDNNTQLIDTFWYSYDKFSCTEKDVASSQEVQRDLNVMYQDVANLKKTTAQLKGDLEKIPRYQPLISSGKAYGKANREGGRIAKELFANKLIVKHLKREKSKGIKIGKCRRVNLNASLSTIQKSVHMLTILLNLNIKQRRKRCAHRRSLVEQTVKGTMDREQLEKQSELLEIEIEDLTNQKGDLRISVDDKLGQFQTQATGVANRKNALAEKVNKYSDKHSEMMEDFKSKESELHKAVGEVYHGEKLKSFIAELRAKNVIYKMKRRSLPHVLTEFSLLHRTIDVLCSIDSTVQDVMNKCETDKENPDFSFWTDCIEKAKNLSDEIIPQIQTMLDLPCRNEITFKEGRKECSATYEIFDMIKEHFAAATQLVIDSKHNLMMKIQMKIDKIVILEREWKNMMLEFGKLDQVYTRLVDDILEGVDDHSYNGELKENKNIIEYSIDQLEQLLADVEVKKMEKLRCVTR